MKKVESVWAALAAKKEALSSGKLELSALDDIRDARQFLEKSVIEADEMDALVRSVKNKIDEAGSEAYGALGELDSLIDVMRSDYAAAERSLDEYQSLANDLGIDAEENEDWRDLQIFLTTDFQDAQSLLQDYYGLLDELTASLRNL